jgi:sulfide:quinone oxidoreductase
MGDGWRDGDPVFMEKTVMTNQEPVKTDDRHPMKRRVTERRRIARRPRVVIAGGGVAGLETLLALHGLAKNRLDITVVEPEVKFVDRAMAVVQPFNGRRVRGVRMQDVVDEGGARWLRRRVDRVEHAHRVVVTRDGIRLPYDKLVIAVGARPPERGWPPGDGRLVFRDSRDAASYRLLLQHIRTGRVKRLAFVRPSGPSWPVPMYELALLTAADCVEYGRRDVELSLITPEAEPLGIFGAQVSAAVRRMLDEASIRLFTSSVGVTTRPGRLDVSPGHWRIPVDRVVTEPQLTGPRLRGVPSDRDGFIHTDAYGRLPGLHGVFAVGDATAFPIKQGGVAAQQADVVAEVIASAVVPDLVPRPFRPVLREALRTGGATQFLRADISGAAGDDSTISTQPLWWPADELRGRYLAPYLRRHVDDATEVLPPGDLAAGVEIVVDPAAAGLWTASGELVVLGAR